MYVLTFYDNANYDNYYYCTVDSVESMLYEVSKGRRLTSPDIGNYFDRDFFKDYEKSAERILKEVSKPRHSKDTPERLFEKERRRAAGIYGVMPTSFKPGSIRDNNLKMSKIHKIYKIDGCYSDEKLNDFTEVVKIVNRKINYSPSSLYIDDSVYERRMGLTEITLGSGEFFKCNEDKDEVDYSGLSNSRLKHATYTPTGNLYYDVNSYEVNLASKGVNYVGYLSGKDLELGEPVEHNVLGVTAHGKFPTKRFRRGLEFYADSWGIPYVKGLVNDRELLEEYPELRRANERATRVYWKGVKDGSRVPGKSWKNTRKKRQYNRCYDVDKTLLDLIKYDVEMWDRYDEMVLASKEELVLAQTQFEEGDFESFVINKDGSRTYAK